MMTVRFLPFVTCAVILHVLGCTSVARSDLVLCQAAQAITHRVTVNVIQTFDDLGQDGAPLFGTPSQQSEVFGFVDDIYAQVGVDVSMQVGATWNSSFAKSGTPGNNDPRPTSDMTAILNAPGAHKSSDPTVINMYMVDIVPGRSQMGSNSGAGRARVGFNGITAYIGPGLPGSSSGRMATAGLIAHEIGHNLGLSHISEANNLLESSIRGHCFNDAQRLTILNSSFAVAVPEPPAYAFLALAASVSLVIRYRQGWRATR